MTEAKVSPTWFTQTTIADVAAANYRAKGLERELKESRAECERLRAAGYAVAQVAEGEF